MVAPTSLPGLTEGELADAWSRSQGLLACDLTHEIEFLAARASSLGKSRANSKLAGLGLRVRSYSVLAAVCSSTDPSQRDLAEFLTIDASQIVPLIDTLETRGLVERVPDPRDRRTRLLRATAKGRALYAEASAIMREAEAESLDGLTAEERDQLRALLSRVAFPRP